MDTGDYPLVAEWTERTGEQGCVEWGGKFLKEGTQGRYWTGGVVRRSQRNTVALAELICLREGQM